MDTMSELAGRMDDQHARLTASGADFTYDRNGLRLGIAALQDELRELHDEWAANKKHLSNPGVASRIRHEVLDIAAVAMLIYRNVQQLNGCPRCDGTGGNDCPCSSGCGHEGCAGTPQEPRDGPVDAVALTRAADAIAAIRGTVYGPPLEPCNCPCSCWSAGTGGLCDACRMNIHAGDRPPPRPTSSP